MNSEEKSKRMMDFIGDHLPPLGPTPGLSAALYTMSELGLWPDDVDSVSEKQALTIYRVVLAVALADGFPEELRM